jgi:ribosomal 50S subunit-recycling heat shock protein
LPTELESIRLEKWLWTARFFKTRKLAADAISGGKVHVNNQRAKPGKEVKPDTTLTITKDTYRWDVTIIALSSQRRSLKRFYSMKKPLKVLQNASSKSFSSANGASCISAAGP